jgi:cell wall-associated NlpC family hydrolase
VLFIAATLTAITNLFDPTQPARPAATGPSTPDTRPCAPTTAPGAGAVGVPGFQADQIANAATIVAVGKQLGVPPHGWVIAVTAALAESGLRNLDHGDHDSLGLFQQRPSQGWGRPDQIRDPTYSATQFYRHLLALPGWQHMSVNDAAQAVQRSATPNTYAPHEHDAHTLINATGNTTCTPTSSTTTGGTRTAAGDSSATATGPSQAAAVAVAFARSQIGTPYRWGGNGATNDGWDCSGLTTAAYAAAGITIPRTAQTQYNAGPKLSTTTTPQPGDLLFYGTRPTNITHVGIATSPTTMIDAPNQGTLVRQDPIQHNLVGITRPNQ